MIRLRSLVLAAAWAAALLCNYWVLEFALADRSDFAGSWVSGLSARSEGSGGIFVALGVASGVAVMAYASLLLGGPLGKRARRGLWALLAAGTLIVLAGAAPLSCAEGLEAGCSLREDGLDVIHALATGGEVVATALAFALVGLALHRPPPADRGCPFPPHGEERTTTTEARKEGTTTLRGVGAVTLVLGAAWLALTVASGVSYLSAGVEEVKGALQRAGQLLFGGWLLVLAWAATRGDGDGERSGAAGGARAGAG